MSKKTEGIGVFDSGVGGLAVVKQLMDHFPNEQIFYLADSMNLPYGNKTAKQVEELCVPNIQFLVKNPLKMVIIACNTAWANACNSLINQFNIPIFDVISPTVKAAVNQTKNKRIALLATESTIDSKVYDQLIKETLSGAEIISIACPLLVPAVEENMLEHKIIKMLLEQYLKPLENANVDTVIIGCTHYSLLKQLIRDALPKFIALVDSSDCVINNAKNYLRENDLFAPTKSKESDFFFVTGSPEKFNRVSSALLKQKIQSIKKGS